METKLTKLVLTMLTMLAMTVAAKAGEFALQKATLTERVSYHRAIDAAIWAMPLTGFKFYRDALAGVGVGPGDVGYYSKLQDWRLQTATPNNTTPYIFTYWNIKDGPVVIEIPPSETGLAIFGTIMDAWQRPLDDIGAMGRDRGRGAKYLIIPPNYDGPLLKNAYVYKQETLHGWTALRPIMAGGPTQENLTKAIAFTKKIRIYPLLEVNNPPKMKFVDLYGKLLEMTPVMDGDIYSQIHEIIQDEVVLDRDLTMMGSLARLGIKKGESFKPDAQLQGMFDKAAPEALQFMINEYHQRLNPKFYKGKKWSVLIPPGAAETELTYEFPSFYDFHARGVLYYAVLSSAKNYGSATFYLDLAETPDGEWLDGSKHYKLVIPPHVPVRDFWAITTYDLETASYIRNVETSSIDSNMKDVKKNTDGSVDIYFGPKPPNGKASNWLPTVPQRRFFLLARFYGPEPALLDGSFELNDIALVK